MAVVTESPRMVMHWKGQTVADLSREFLNTNGAVKHASVSIPRKSDLGSLVVDPNGVWVGDREPVPFHSLREMASSLKLSLIHICERAES